MGKGEGEGGLMAEHTPTPWQQGRLLSTTVTREWDDDYREQKEYEESALVCVNFHASDEGRSRRIIAVATHMDGNAGANAAFIVRAVNCHEELVKALEDAIELINDINGCHGCADNSADPDESRRKALAAALAKAKEGALDESQMLLQDLDEETL